MAPTVPRCHLAPDLSISRILTGLWQIADMERDGSTLDLTAAADAMGPYVAQGLTTFDMADHYGSAELIAGRFRASQGPTSEHLTKWVPTPGPLTRDVVHTAVQRALDRLQTDTIDLLQYHAWNYADPGWLDGLFWLDELRQQGLIRHLGLTNFDTAHVRMVLHSGIPIVSNQICYSLLDQRAAHGMAELCASHGVFILAFGTLAGGFLTDRWLDQPEPDWEHLATWSQMKYGRFIQAAGGWAKLQALLRVLHGIAQQHGVSIANIATRFILDAPAVGGVIIGARLGQSTHINDTLRMFTFDLDASDRAAIIDCLTRLLPIPGDTGDEYRKPPFLTASGDLSHHLDSMPVPYTPVHQPDDRRVVFSGTPWESTAGYCRALRKGDRILVSGTTATHRDVLIGGDDAEAQTHFIIDKIEGAIQSLGGRLEDVVRTRLFVANTDDWEAVARAHGARFSTIQPTNTLVQAGLIGEGYLVEMEAEAWVG